LTPVNRISFTLARPLPLLNVQLRTHWAKRRKAQIALAWEVVDAAQPLPEKPMTKARVTVERYSIGTPDTDNLCVKHLLDVLCPQSKRHPVGLGVIVDDSPACCELHVKAVKVSKRADQKTVVTVEAIA